MNLARCKCPGVLPGERWRHRQTRALVRIEVRLLGLLSFSVLREGRWLQCRHVWDEEQFRQEFERHDLICAVLGDRVDD